MLKPITLDPSVTGSSKDVSQIRLEKACSEFESIFLTYMLKSMGETLVEDGFLGNSNESKIIKSMFDENLAQGIARAGGMGLGQLIFEQFKE
jgi:flagellar protein FlgJ